MTTATYSMTSSVFDAEERIDTNAVDRTSSDLEFGRDAVAQYVGMYWEFIDVPQGAVIDQAYITFVAKEVQTGSMTVRLHGHATDSSIYFTLEVGNISNRPLTTAFVDWSPPDWTVIDQAYQSADIAPILQELVNREGWQSGNHVAILALPQDGNRRTAWSYNGAPEKAPTLTVTWSEAPTGPPQRTVPRVRIQIRLVDEGQRGDPLVIVQSGASDPVEVVDPADKRGRPVKTSENLLVGGTYRVRFGK